VVTQDSVIGSRSSTHAVSGRSTKELARHMRAVVSDVCVALLQAAPPSLTPVTSCHSSCLSPSEALAYKASDSLSSTFLSY